VERNDIGDQSFIGLDCETGDYRDCVFSLSQTPDKSSPGCEGYLIFSDLNSTCGAHCKSSRTKRSSSDDNGRMGWTKSFKNTDVPRGRSPNYGTGDHEFFSAFVKDDIWYVYGSDGTAYTNCEPKAIHVRQQNTATPWWILANSYTILFSKSTTFYRNAEHKQFEEETYSKTLKPNYGLVRVIKYFLIKIRKI